MKAIGSAPASPAPDDATHHEGPEAARRFEHTLSRVLTVSKDELAKLEAAYQERRRHLKKTRGIRIESGKP